jgi:hypothetical protein
MNRIKYLLLFILFGVITACEKDNYDGPDAELYGTFIDEATGEPLAQDIINGTVIELIEHGWVKDQTNVTQTLVVKGDGSYRNSQIFAGKYVVRAVRGNFVDIPPVDTLEIRGSTKLDFKVTPYLRIKDASIVRNGNSVTATFKIQQNTTQNVSKIGLYVHPNPNVGQPMTLTSRVEQTLNRVTTPTETFTVSINLANNTAFLKAGQEYYFRIGALSSANAAKFNYAPAVKIKI